MTTKPKKPTTSSQTRFKEVLLFGTMLIVLVVKYLNITKLSGTMAEFLGTYKFVLTDSFDWLATGLTLFNNDSITMRNPGLPLVVKFLNHFGLVYLLPLLNQLVFLSLVGAVYYTVKHLTKNMKFAVFFAVLVFTNYSFNVLTNYILADMYAVAAISVALYLLLTKRYTWSFVAIGVSMLFQNFAYFLYVIWVGYFVTENWPMIKRLLQRKAPLTKQKLATLMPIAIPGLMVLPWHVYKFVTYGNLFYTKVDQLAVINPTLANIPFYSYHAYVMWGPLVLITVAAVIATLIKKRSFFANKTIIFLLVGFVFSVVFWGLFYDWPDRRFLLYVTPWFYALSAITIYRYVPKTPRLVKYGLACIVVYVAALPVVFVGEQKLIPIVQDKAVVITTESGDSDYHIQTTPGFEDPIMALSPTLYDSFNRSTYYTQEESGKYVAAAKIVEQTYDKQKVCVEREDSVKTYALSSVTLILHPDTNLDQLKLTCK